MLTPELLVRDLKVAVRSLARTKGLAITVVLTLALGHRRQRRHLQRGARRAAAPTRQPRREPADLHPPERARPGHRKHNVLGSRNQDLKARVKTLTEFGDFSTVGFSMVGLGEPREVRAGVVDGSYFEVMGLHPVLGRLLDAHDDGPNAAGAAVLTYRFWTTVLKRDPSVIGKTVRLDTRMATIVGVLEPSVPYPAETEIIANVVTSPHHLSATMVTGRVHRMTELFGRLAPGATIEQARAELNAVHGAMVKAHPEAYSPRADVRISAVRLRDQITSRAKTDFAGPARGFRSGFRDRLLQRRQLDSRGYGSARRRIGDSRGARRKRRLATARVTGR
jgi:putative ABC transport system permease protein